ncbi:hypothetical protein J2W48_000897 [Flavobacterium piscis]|uniref:HTTM domain-containing protein n=2 Tax=Flavobacterium piscis TaxID=1114874 RepID=A0ABU1Y410_9FLAO|nr:hypothetical protein [Flavobacterium piscis]
MNIDYIKENIFSRMQLPGSALQLALFRIALGLQILYSSSSKLLHLLLVVDGTKQTKTIFPQFLDNIVEVIAVPYLQGIVQVLSVFLVLGLFTRIILPVLFVAFLLLFGFWYNHFNAPVPWLYIWFPLLIMCFCRSADTLSLDKYFKTANSNNELPNNVYRWPVEVISGWFAYIYFAAGLAKIFPVSKGLSWLNGGTSQEIIYDRFLDSAFYYIFGKPLFDYSSNGLVFGLLSFSSLIIELLCVLIFFTNRYNYLLIFLVISMHFFLYLTGVPGFMQTALVLSICLVNSKVFNLVSHQLNYKKI